MHKPPSKLVLPTVDTCRWRRPPAGGDPAACGLAASLLGVAPGGLVAVADEACAACCRSFPPTRRTPNPVVAGLLHAAASRVLDVGGTDECGVEAAARGPLEDALALRLAAADLGNLPVSQAESSNAMDRLPPSRVLLCALLLLWQAEAALAGADLRTECVCAPRSPTVSLAFRCAAGLFERAGGATTGRRGLASLLEAAEASAAALVEAQAHLAERGSVIAILEAPAALASPSSSTGAFGTDAQSITARPSEMGTTGRARSRGTSLATAIPTPGSQRPAGLCCAIGSIRAQRTLWRISVRGCSEQDDSTAIGRTLTS